MSQVEKKADEEAKLELNTPQHKKEDEEELAEEMDEDNTAVAVMKEEPKKKVEPKLSAFE